MNKKILNKRIQDLKDKFIGMKYNNVKVIDIYRERSDNQVRTTAILICDDGHTRHTPLEILKDKRYNIKIKCKEPECRFKHMINKKYGYLKVIKIVKQSKSKTKLLVKCICGKEMYIIPSNLRNNNAVSCGCKRQKETTICNMTFKTRTEAIKHFNITDKILYSALKNPKEAKTIISNYKPRYSDIPQRFRKGIHTLIYNSINIFTTNKSAKYDTTGKTNTKIALLDEISYFTNEPLSAWGMFYDGGELSFINDNHGLSKTDASITYEKNIKSRHIMYAMCKALNKLGFKINHSTQDVNHALLNVKEEMPFQYIHLDYNGPLTYSALHAIEASLEYFPCIMVTVQQYGGIYIPRNEKMKKKDGSDMFVQFDPISFPSTKCKTIKAMPYIGLRRAKMWSYIITAH